MRDRRFVLRGASVLPLVSAPFRSISSARQETLLAGHDPVAVLEASSTVLADIEQSEYDAIARRLEAPDRSALARWLADVRSRGNEPSPTPVHPLALLAATTMALAMSHDGPRSELIRDDIANRLVRVATQYNAATVEGRSSRGQDGALVAMARSVLWRAIDNEDWTIWTADLTRELSAVGSAQPALQQFEDALGLSLREWFFRTLGERATRAHHGAASWGGADEVDPELERAWLRAVSTSVSEATSSAALAVQGARHHHVANPFDLQWLAKRPIVLADDGRRFSMWLGSLNRAVLPTSLAQLLSDTLGISYPDVASWMGRATETILNTAVQSSHISPGEAHILEADMPASISKCDYLIERADELVALEFTVMSPSRALSEGSPAAVDDFVEKLAGKFSQAYAAFTWADPARTRRWLPVVVLGAPMVVDPLLNERVHERLVQKGHAMGDESELMTCHAPEFLDLVEWSTQRSSSVAESILEWRNGPERGANLDWWLSDRNALRTSGRRRVAALASEAEAVLTKA